jgi:hypothetical protein
MKKAEPNRNHSEYYTDRYRINPSNPTTRGVYLAD